MIKKEIDLMEYSTDILARRNYVSSLNTFCVGVDTTSGMGSSTANYVVIAQYTASKSGYIDHIQITSAATGLIKLAIYSDDGSDKPNVLLGETGGVGCITGLTHLIPLLSPAQVISGTKYWIAEIQNISGVSREKYQAGPLRYYKAETFNTYTYPSTFSITGYTKNTTALHELAGFAPTSSVLMENTIKTQGDYSLKINNLQTDSLNNTIIRQLGRVVDLSNINRILFDMYAERNGANITISLRNGDGGTTSSITPNITNIEEWQTIEWDISEIDNTDKNHIDQIIITIINADYENTIYLDNFYAPINTTAIGIIIN